jgi:hypothetical protein
MGLLDGLFGKIKQVSNLQQACDATLAFYYKSVNVFDIEVIRDEKVFAPLKESNHALYVFKLWGPAVGFKKVPQAKSCCSVMESIRALKLEESEGIKSYSHIVFEGKRIQLTGPDKGKENEFATIYRLHPADYSEIVTGYF